MVVTAPRSSAGNNREFFWSPDTPVGRAQTVCATFASGRGLDQQGLVLRLVGVGGSRVRALTVTRNVFAGAFDVVNFHVWDTRAPTSRAFVPFASAVVPALSRTAAAYPLRMCARTVVATDSVQFVVWRPGATPPSWGSSTQGGEAPIPSTAPSTGGVGWFAGHLGPGSSMTYTDLRVDGTVPAALP